MFSQIARLQLEPRLPLLLELVPELFHFISRPRLFLHHCHQRLSVPRRHRGRRACDELSTLCELSTKPRRLLPRRSCGQECFLPRRGHRGIARRRHLPHLRLKPRELFRGPGALVRELSLHLFGLKLHPRVHLSLELLCLLPRSLRLDSQRFEPSLGCIVLLCGVFNQLVLLFFSFQLSSERGRLVCRGICPRAKCPHLVPEISLLLLELLGQLLRLGVGLDFENFSALLGRSRLLFGDALRLLRRPDRRRGALLSLCRGPLERETRLGGTDGCTLPSCIRYRPAHDVRD